MWRDLNTSQFGQGGDLTGFGEAAHIGWAQIENRRSTLVDEAGEILEALEVFSCRNGDRGGRGDFGHFIHAGGGRCRLFDPEQVVWFERFAGRDRSFGTALTVATVDQVHFVACSVTKATENHFVVGDVLLGWHSSASLVDRVLPDFPVAKSFVDQPGIDLHDRTGLLGQVLAQRAPGIFVLQLLFGRLAVVVDPDLLVMTRLVVGAVVLVDL